MKKQLNKLSMALMPLMLFISQTSYAIKKDKKTSLDDLKTQFGTGTGGDVTSLEKTFFGGSYDIAYLMIKGIQGLVTLIAVGLFIWLVFQTGFQQSNNIDYGKIVMLTISFILTLFIIWGVPALVSKAYGIPAYNVETIPIIHGTKSLVGIV